MRPVLETPKERDTLKSTEVGKNIVTKARIAFGSILLLYAAAHEVAIAQASESEPTKEATWEFIKSKLATTVTTDTSEVQYSYALEDCTFIVRKKVYTNPQASYAGGRRELFHEEESRVPLGAMDPSRCSGGGGHSGVGLYATADKEVVSVISSGRDSPIGALRGEPWRRYSDRSYPYETLDAIGSRQAEQLARAFSHLIERCGGKKELF